MRKGRTSRDIPPPLELQCLSALWAMGEVSVQVVRAHLAAHKPLAYTTVMTMLDRLARKQMVSRRKVGRSFVYTPLITREQVRRLAVRELTESLFDGSEAALLDYLKGAPAAAAAAAAAPGFDRADEASAFDTALL